MSDVKFSARAFCKMVLHAMKYPHCAINGVLLAKSHTMSTNNKEIEFVDAVPLFHISINLTPMAEIALMQIDELASTRGLVIAGYYGANENLRDNTFEKAYNRIAEKISANCNPSYIVVLNNVNIINSINIPEATALKVAQLADSGNFKQIEEQHVSLVPSDTTPQALMVLMQQKAFNDLVDFDNHLDDISLDWMNVQLNKSIEEYL